MPRPYSVRFAGNETTAEGQLTIYTCAQNQTMIVQGIQLSANFAVGVMEAAVIYFPAGSAISGLVIFALTGVVPESQNFGSWDGKCVLLPGDNLVLLNGNGGDYTYCVSGVLLDGVNPGNQYGG